MAHLVAGAPPPAEYVELLLCRDVYHCTPNQLHDIPLQTIMAHLACINMEAKYRKK